MIHTPPTKNENDEKKIKRRGEERREKRERRELVLLCTICLSESKRNSLSFIYLLPRSLSPPHGLKEKDFL